MPGLRCKALPVDIHAYVLMTNHVHLLMTPQRAEGISRVMQSVGRRYVQYINWIYRRSGTLWEGRHKASLVPAEDYLFTCQRYIELDPVRAGMVEHPGNYRWSSYRANACGSENELITPHELYRGLASSADERQQAYRELFRTELDPEAVHRVRSSADCWMPLGDSRFREQIEAALQRSIGREHRGRPRGK